ncbi:MAG: carbonic anhydrase family protein [Endomicrobia bacterium]|nr:carbonic anhydrase family protein [Endomicrobiia bacterium]
MEKKDRVLNSSDLSLEALAKLTPDEVLEILKKGNEDFVNGNLTVRNNSQRVRDAALGQKPIAVVLSCLDSRLPVEDIFHRGIGDIFVARVAGNIINDDILGSLEFACKASTAKLVLVLGHEHCGAIQSSIEDVKLGHMTNLLSKIKPSVCIVSEYYEGEKSSRNPDFVKNVSIENVKHSIREIRAKSPILKEMEDKGEIIITGGMYNMHRGKVVFMDAG